MGKRLCWIANFAGDRLAAANRLPLSVSREQAVMLPFEFNELSVSAYGLRRD